MTQDNNSNVSIGPKEIGAVQKSDEDDVDEFLGFLKFSTTGDAVVPREWLVEQWEKHELPMKLLPKEPSKWSAYRRAMREVLEDEDLKHYSVYSNEYNRRFDCKLEMEKSDDAESNNLFILYANVFFPEEIVGEDGGDWRRTRLAYFDFLRPDDGPEGMTYKAEIDDDNIHYDRWMKARARAQRLFGKYQTHHVESDLQTMLQKFRADVNAVEIRRAVYFVGNHYQDRIEGFSQVWRAMNQFKEDGEEMRIEKTPVLNLEEQRDLVASRVRETVEEMVGEIVSESIEEWEQEKDKTAEETASDIMEELKESEDLAAEYNQLLRMELSVKNKLEDLMEELTEEQEDIVERVLNQQDLEDY